MAQTKRTTTTRTPKAAALAVVTIGANYSPAAYAGTAPIHRPELAHHEFTADAEGRLEHRIDGQLRATVAPEGLAEYARVWPACAELAAKLKAADR